MQPVTRSLFALSLFVIPHTASAAEWSSQYLTWELTDPTVTEIWNVDQQVWIPKTAAASFWPFVWTWTGSSEGGYIGLQERSASDQNARFSIWNALQAEGPNCRDFSGEGVGKTCEIPVTIDTDKYYRTRLWRLEAASDGQWWGGWLIEEDDTGALVEHFIGKILEPTGATSVSPSAIQNFVEEFGPNVSPCKDIPLSIAGFTPPAVNYKGAGTGEYGGYTRFSVSTKAAGNACTDGTEGTGALISVKPFSFPFAEGVLAFMGGTTAEHVLPAGTTAPKDMPDS